METSAWRELSWYYGKITSRETGRNITREGTQAAYMSRLIDHLKAKNKM